MHTFDAKIIDDIEETKILVEELLGSHTLPHFLLDDDKYNKHVAGLYKDHNRIGISYGAAMYGEYVFHLHVLYIKKEYRSRESIEYLLGCLFESVLNAGIQKAIWRYTIKEDEIDLRSRILSNIPLCHVGEVIKATHIKVKSEDLERIKKSHKIYNPQLCVAGGYDVLLWSELSSALKRKVHEREVRAQNDKRYLSPFTDRNNTVPDESTSLVLVKRDENDDVRTIGWMICHKTNESELEILNFYIYPEERVRMIGHSFGAYAFDKITSSCESFGFGIAEGNLQMETFLRKYLKPIIYQSTIRCNLHFDLHKSV